MFIVLEGHYEMQYRSIGHSSRTGRLGRTVYKYPSRLGWRKPSAYKYIAGLM